MPVLPTLLVAMLIIASAGCASTRNTARGTTRSPKETGAAPAPSTSRVSRPPTPPKANASAPEVAPQPAPPVAAQPAQKHASQPATNAAAVSQPVKRSSYVSLREWCATAGLNDPVPTTDDAQAFYITTSTGTLLLKIDSQAARWNGMEIHLGFPPMLVQDQVYLRAADIKSTIAPLLLPCPPPIQRGKVIVLDPGHGGPDSGARSVVGGHEKDYTLDWALRLRGLLQADGWEVFMTRSTDIEMPLTNRVKLAESVQADLFLSLHFNSSAPDKAGIETYCLTPAGVPSTLTRGYTDELDLTLPNNSYDARNLQLGVLLHRALLEVTGKRDRGIRRARFPVVLRNQNRPAVLIEGGYLSNMLEARMISSPVYRHKLADAIATALRPYAPGLPASLTNSIPALGTTPKGS